MYTWAILIGLQNSCGRCFSLSSHNHFCTNFVCSLYRRTFVDTLFAYEDNKMKPLNIERA